jgi:cyclophilin family peptidyl-prolyl cis-trans isomerase
MLKSALTTIAFFFVVTIGLTQPFTGKPQYDIAVYRAGTYVGTVRVELFPTIAPNHVHNFDSLVNTQFYDSTAFHRVIPGFMIQGGDPNSRHGPIATWGYGDPSQPTVDAEFSVAQHKRGILSAARDADTNSATSQFFICVANASWLNGQYSVYGRVVSGMNIVDTIVSEPRDVNDNPLLKMEMFIDYAGSNDSLAIVPTLNLPVDWSFSTSLTRVLSWHPTSDGIIYHVEVSADSNFSTLFYSGNVGTTTKVVTGLATATTYYWRVNSNNGGDTSDYSEVWHFTTSATGVDDHAFNPVTVYPNFGQGEFTFGNVAPGSTIAIYDITGRCITNQVATRSECAIDLTGCAKGMYFYVIRDEAEAVQLGKLLVE